RAPARPRPSGGSGSRAGSSCRRSCCHDDITLLSLGVKRGRLHARGARPATGAAWSDQPTPTPSGDRAGPPGADPPHCYSSPMSIKPDWWIRDRALEGMTTPFDGDLVRAGVVRLGL